MGCKFSKNVAWLKPFYEAAEELLPKGKLKEVIGYTLPLGRDHWQHGCCFYVNDTQVKISLWLESDWVEKGKLVKRKPKHIDDMLFLFAHELAHVPQRRNSAEDYHNVEHWVLMLKIMQKFTRVLKRKKVKTLVKRTSKVLGKKS